MNNTIMIVIGILVVIYGWYIILTRRKNQVLESLSGIDVQLTKRYDLVPNILKIAQKFMEHEKSLITEVTALRAKIPVNYQHDSKEAVAQYFATSSEMATKMSNLLMQMENYPNLKSDQTMLQAQQTYNEVEEHISAARRFYNSSVTELNNAMIFPGNLIAKLTNIDSLPFYHANATQTQSIDADQVLGAR